MDFLRQPGFFFSFVFLLASAAAAVGEPQQIAICGEGTEVADREPESLAATSATGVLPEPNSELDLMLAPNGTWPVHAMYTPGFETKRCALRIEACAWCTINVKLEPSSAHFTDFQIEALSKCEKEVAGLQKSCFNLELIEEKADPRGVSSGGQMSAKDVFRTTSLFGHAGDEFESTSSSLVLVVSMRSLEADPQLFRYILQMFPLRIRARSNAVVIVGSPLPAPPHPDQTATGIVETVRFPNAYPRHLVQNVTLVNKNATGFVRLTFDDFHLSSRSELRILDTDGRLLFSTRGEHRRPPAVVSNGPRLQLLFFANGATQPVGWRARYQMVAQQSWAQMPSAFYCDALLENVGGQITLNGRTDLLGQNVDCVWTIAQLPAFSHAFDQTRLRVEEFGIVGSGLSLEVRKGVSSGPLLLLLTSPQEHKELLERQPTDGFAVDSSEHGAFYIRLRGLLTSVNDFSIVYAQFYRWATASCLNGEFHCTNGKCISPELRCDQLDHCGDQTDEQCGGPELPHPPLFEDHEFEPLRAPLILTIGLLFTLFLFTIIAFVLLSRISRRPLHLFFSDRLSSRPGCPPDAPTELEGGLPRATGEYGSIHTIGERRFYVLPAETQVIEAPPTYQDAIKHAPLHVPCPADRSYVNDGFTTTEATHEERRSATEENEQEGAEEEPSAIEDDPKEQQAEEVESEGTAEPQESATKKVDGKEKAENEDWV